MAEQKKLVYLSYAHEDQKWADLLATGMTEKGFAVWYDRHIFPGDNWGLVMGKALEESDAMVVLISPAAVRSSIVRSDINYALGSTRFKDRLIPVTIKHAPDLPWVLRHFRSVPATNPDQTLRGVIAALQKSFQPEKSHAATVARK